MISSAVMSLHAFFIIPCFAGTSSTKVCSNAYDALTGVVREVGALMADDVVVDVVFVGVRGATVLLRLNTSFMSFF